MDWNLKNATEQYKDMAQKAGAAQLPTVSPSKVDSTNQPNQPAGYRMPEVEQKPNQPGLPNGYTIPELEQTPAQREQYAAQMAFRQQTATQLLIALREFTVRVVLAREELPAGVRQELYSGLLTAASWLGGQ